MPDPKYSIGIDLGTSNSVLAYAPLDGVGGVEALTVPQWETASTVAESETLPSCLYLPDSAVAEEIGASDWLVGRLAQRKLSETPGRVVKSAKSWLCHHAADRSAPFLPWGSDSLGENEKISPVAASAKILEHLRAAWDVRFAALGADYAFDAQAVTITVPASFDAAAQKLTLAAADMAGYPASVRLLEEPQAAFYAWLAREDDPGATLPDSHDGARRVLVVDIGGGTSDFSLFEIAHARNGHAPAIKRVAVSDHILLGGDNIDLAIAHLIEPRLGAAGGLSPGQWDHLVARSRALKEAALGEAGAADEVFSIAIPARGSSLFAGSLSAQVARADIENLVLDGFFPDARATDRPRQALGAVKEFGLPYAHDGAVTRHLAAFLRDRPAVDAVLFNGGSLHAARLRERLTDQIGRWQDGRRPLALENARPDLAVAYGAAYAGERLARNQLRIEAGAARAVFLEALRKPADGEAAQRSLVCILPHGAAPGRVFETGDLDLSLRLNRPVRFQAFTSTRHDETKLGDAIDPRSDVLVALPPLETVATVARRGSVEPPAAIPVRLTAEVNELGLLQVACRSLLPEIRQTWPLEFNLRPHERATPAPAPSAPALTVAPEALAEAGRRIAAAFAPAGVRSDKMTAPRLLQSLEQALGRSRAEWSGVTLRELWTRLEASEAGRALSVEHEEVWLILAGFLLRPGFGVAMDEARIEALWTLCSEAPRFAGKRTKLQLYILWRRVAGGLSQERQEALLEVLPTAGNFPAEAVRMVGAFERISLDAKAAWVERFLEATVALASEKRHVTPYLAALGGLLSRTPFYAGPETVVAPSRVESAYEALRKLDWRDPEFVEAQTLFLRAARVVDDRRLDVSKTVRNAIADKLQKAGVSALRIDRLRHFQPVERSERQSLYGETLPPGLILNA
jgi:molecular chaperone DnaK (HSP70)